MPTYNYTGINDKGKKTNGVVDSENEKAARAKLRKMGVYPTSLSASGRGSAGGGAKLSLNMNVDLNRYFQRIKVQDIAMMTRQLSTLVASGIPLVDSLQALEDQLDNVKLKTIITTIRERVTEGTKLSDAMKAYPKVFSDLYVNMVNAGENSGALDLVLERLADFSENQARLRNKISGAMIYPMIMSVVGFALMIFLFVVIVPKITAIFEDIDIALPLPTRVLITFSDSLINWWWIMIILLVLVVYGVRRWKGTDAGKEFLDRRSLKLPLFGNLIRMVMISRFSRTLSTLLSSGVPLLNALDIVKNIISNSVLKQVVENTRNGVQEGEPIAEPLKRSGEFPPIVTHMIAIGEKTGQLEKMLERVADSYDVQVENTVSALTTIIEPIMILTMASIVAFVVMSILLPLMKMSSGI